MEKQVKIRVCFIIDSLSRAGTETQLLLLLQSLDRTKIEPYLCLLRGDSDSSRILEPTDLPVLRLHLARLFSFGAILTAFHFLRYLRNEKIKVVQTYFTDATRFAAPLAKLAGCTVLGSRRNIGHWIKGKDRFFAKILNRFIIDLIVTNCHAAQNTLILQEKLPTEKVCVLPNGINLKPYRSFVDWRPPPYGEAWKVGMVGNLRRVKGIDIFIHAAKLVLEIYPSTQFVIAGGGNIEKYQNDVAEIGISENVSLLGSIEDVPSLLSRLDMAILPSRAEGMSGALLEYMAAGRPIVATAVGGNTELIIHEKNGLLVETENARVLADAILRFVGDTPLALNCAAVAKKDATDNFSSATLADAYTQLIFRLASNELIS